MAWLTPSVLQTRHSYHRVQTCATHARISLCLLCVPLTQSKCNVSYWHKGSGCNSTTYLLTNRYKRLYADCDGVPSDTSSSTISSGTRGSYAYIIGLCSAATQLGSHAHTFHWVVLHSDTTGFSRPHIPLCSMTTQCIVSTHTISVLR